MGARVTAAERGRALLVDSDRHPRGPLPRRAAHPRRVGDRPGQVGRWAARGRPLRGGLGTRPALPLPGRRVAPAARRRITRALDAADAGADLSAVRSWFDERSFVEVETPLAVPSPGLDLHLAALEARGMRAPRFLITSPEYQMKRLLAGGLTRIYQMCRCFRRGEEGALHQPEFTMLEWYRGFAGAEEIMRDTEELVASVARALGQGSTVIPGAGAAGGRGPAVEAADRPRGLPQAGRRGGGRGLAGRDPLLSASSSRRLSPVWGTRSRCS